MGIRIHRTLAGLALAGLCACDDVSCWWTDDPSRDPWASHETGRSYRTADELFEIVLHADGTWPPRVGVHTVRIEWSIVDGPRDVRGTVSAARPFLRDGERVAATLPVAVELEPDLWRIAQLQLDAAGQWVVPVILEHGELDDSIELRIEVPE